MTDPLLEPSRKVPRIGLALGGGSARGLAHVLVLEAFDELGIKPAIIAGTSMGAICGAAYAAGMSGQDMRAAMSEMFGNRARFAQRFAGKLRGGLSSLWSLRAPGVVDNVTLFEMLLPEAFRRDFSALKIPFLAIAADFYAMEQIILDSGPLIPALAASSSLPGLARPVVLDGRVLIDGGYVNPVPYDVLQGRVDFTLAVDVTGDTRPRPDGKLPGTFELLTGATQLLFHSVTREKTRLQAPDAMIRPKVGDFASMDYFRCAEILEAAAPVKLEAKNKLSRWLQP